MSKNRALQIVAAVLEDYADADPDRPGGPEDVWRKGGHKKMKFDKDAFTGKRASEADNSVADEDEKDAKPEKPKKSSRFDWKPTSEALIQELGGHYCFTCKKPTAADHKGQKSVCSHCGSELNYKGKRQSKGKVTEK